MAYQEHALVKYDNLAFSSIVVKSAKRKEIGWYNLKRHKKGVVVREFHELGYPISFLL